MEEVPEDDNVVELQSAQEDLGIDTMEYDDEFDEMQDIISSGQSYRPCRVPYFPTLALEPWWIYALLAVICSPARYLFAHTCVTKRFLDAERGHKWEKTHAYNRGVMSHELNLNPFYGTSVYAGQLVGEELLRSEYALPESAATQMRLHHVAASVDSMHATDCNSHASGPFSRPVTPGQPMNSSFSRRHMGDKDARRDVSQSDSALTMRARAEKAAMHVPGKNAVKVDKEEYVTAFAGKELARTPPQGNR